MPRAPKTAQGQGLSPRGGRLPYAVRESRIHGRGLFAARDLSAGEFVAEYFGEKITKLESLARRKRRADGSVYTVALDENFDIDGDVPRNDARFANHSCRPNCELVREGDSLRLVAARAIASGEELTFDYGFSFSECAAHPCRCGAPDCCGYIVSAPERRLVRRFFSKKNARGKKQG